MNKDFYYYDAALELLKSSIECVTVNDEANEKNLANLFKEYMKDTKCVTTVQDIDKNRANIISILKGRDSSKMIVLNGHLDTVPFGSLETWDTPPDKAIVIEDELYARGASDMKSGLCAALFAIKLLSEEGYVPKYDVAFIGTADEETDGIGATKINELGILDRASAIVIGEPTDNKISLSSKGTLWVELDIKGKTSHAAYPQEGINSIAIAYELYTNLNNIVKDFPRDIYVGDSTCSITKLSGGVKINMIPDSTNMLMDIRLVPDISNEEVIKNMKDIILELESKYNGLRIFYKILTDRSPVGIAEDETLVKSFTKAFNKVTGVKADFCGTNFFSDASIFNRKYNVPTILFGCGQSSQAHKPNEKVSITQYMQCIACYYEYLKMGE